MWSKLVRGPQLATIAIGVMAVNIAWSSALSQIASIGLSAILGLAWMKQPSQEASTSFAIGYKKRFGAALLLTFIVLLVTLPISPGISWRVVFADGRWILSVGIAGLRGRACGPPVLAEGIRGAGSHQPGNVSGWLRCCASRSRPAFHAFRLPWHVNGRHSRSAYRVACDVFASILVDCRGIAILGLLANSPRLSGVLIAINASVVGILLSALYDPIWVTAIQRPASTLRLRPSWLFSSWSGKGVRL